jgi:para-nitrobenzyl esterase
MLDGEGDVEGIVERVGAMVKDMWVAFARGEDLGRSKFTIDENFRFP